MLWFILQMVVCLGYLLGIGAVLWHLGSNRREWTSLSRPIEHRYAALLHTIRFYKFGMIGFGIAATIMLIMLTTGHGFK